MFLYIVLCVCACVCVCVCLSLVTRSLPDPVCQALCRALPGLRTQGDTTGGSADLRQAPHSAADCEFTPSLCVATLLLCQSVSVPLFCVSAPFFCVSILYQSLSVPPFIFCVSTLSLCHCPFFPVPVPPFSVGEWKWIALVPCVRKSCACECKNWPLCPAVSHYALQLTRMPCS